MKRTVGNNEWLDIGVLDDYLEGKLDAGMMHKIERISLEDPFVAQALAGLTEAKKRTQTLSILQKQLQERVAQKPVERKVWRLTSHRLSIAATAAVLFITVGALFLMRENQRREQEQLAAKRAKGIEVNLEPQVAATAPKDTAAAVALAKSPVAQQKVADALDKAIKSAAVIAKNSKPQQQFLQQSSLQQREMAAAKLKNETAASQSMVGVPTAAPNAPVQVLESRVDGIQTKTDPYARSVKGTVYDVYGRPLSGADVKMVGDDIRAITNRSGEFTLPLGKETDKVTLEVASLGFARKNVEAKVNEKLDVRLEEDAKSLSEVVVVSTAAMAKKAKEEVLIGIPTIGWKAYSEYLVKENKLYADGTKIVMLNFTILPDGTPSNIKVAMSAGKKLDEEAIRLLQSGSKWNYPAGKNKTTAISIKF